MSEVKPQSLIDHLIEGAKQRPDETALIFIADDASVEVVTNAQTYANAISYAQALEQAGVKPGELVVLVLGHSLELISTLWGALVLGAIPSVFPYLTAKLSAGAYADRLQTLLSHDKVDVVITLSEFKDDMAALLSDAGCRVLSLDDIEPAEVIEPAPALDQLPSDDQIAYMQYSSGTTGLQKAVGFTHRAIINQIAGMLDELQVVEGDTIVSWLPLYHDMGLLKGILLPTFANIPVVLMSPAYWVRSPKRMLLAIHEYHGTICTMPNFAFNYCVQRIRDKDLEGVDLSHVRALYNSSEPIQLSSLEMFVERFAPYGLSEFALGAGYGMVENTGAITYTSPEERLGADWVLRQELLDSQRAQQTAPHAQGAVPIVSSGRPIVGTEVKIVNEAGVSIAERHVGEIIIRGNCMLKEYWNRPELTAKAIRDGWFHTGDLGYMADGQLYVTGRMKDVIINAGKIVYPTDVEAIADSIDGIRPDRSVCFGVLDEEFGSERIVLVAELKLGIHEDQHVEVERELRRRVVQELDVTLSEVSLVKKRWVVITTSGKIARAANRDKWLSERESPA